MRDCIEFIEDIVAVHLFQPDELSISFPFNVAMTSVESKDIKKIYNPSAQTYIPITIENIKNSRGIAISSYYNNVPYGSIEARRGITVKENSKMTIAGTCYTTKISASTSEDIDIIRSLVYDMSSREYFNILLVDSSDNVFLLRGEEPATNIVMSSNLPVSSLHNIEIEIVSVNGIIPVIF